MKWEALPLSLSISVVLYFQSAALADQSADSQGSTYPPLAPSFPGDTPPPDNQNLSSQFSGDISSLEQKFFARDYSGEPIEKRLDRIERVVYGSEKTGSVQGRITRLLLDVPNLPYNTRDQEAQSYPQASVYPDPAFSYPSSSVSLSDKLSTMEKEVFGKVYSSEPLMTRVSRLENAVFAGQEPQTFTPIITRINRLVQALQPRFNLPQPAQQSSMLGRYKNYNNETDSTGSPSSGNKQNDGEKHPVLHKLGKILGGIGTIAGETIGGVAAGSMMGYGYGYGGYGWGYPGFGFPGYYGYGPRGFMGCYW